MKETVRNIVDAIRSGNSFLITTHESPDGDAVGSALGMACFLRAIGKHVCVHLCDPVPEIYEFLPGADLVQRHIPDQAFDVCFVLDIGELKRAGAEFCSFNRKGRLINLDHHLTCEAFGSINLIDVEAAATGLLVYRVAREFGFSFDADTALCLYVAVITDTGSFRYSNANREAFTVAGEMIECGVNAWDVAEQLYESQPQKRLELLALALNTLEVICSGQAASVTVTPDMYEKTGTNAELTDGFVNYPRSIRGVEVAIFFRQVDLKRVKVGFRSKGKVNVAGYAEAFGGGGHHNAAGCTLEGGIDDVKSMIYQVVSASF